MDALFVIRSLQLRCCVETAVAHFSGALSTIGICQTLALKQSRGLTGNLILLCCLPSAWIFFFSDGPIMLKLISKSQYLKPISELRDTGPQTV